MTQRIREEWDGIHKEASYLYVNAHQAVLGLQHIYREAKNNHDEATQTAAMMTIGGLKQMMSDLSHATILHIAGPNDPYTLTLKKSYSRLSEFLGEVMNKIDEHRGASGTMPLELPNMLK